MRTILALAPNPWGHVSSTRLVHGDPCEAAFVVLPRQGDDGRALVSSCEAPWILERHGPFFAIDARDPIGVQSDEVSVPEFVHPHGLFRFSRPRHDGARRNPLGE